MNRRLTIGLPVYNGEQYLARSLDSLLRQSFSDFELVISSNASTDGTDDICSAYQRSDDRVRFHRQPTNIGAVPNHNFVLAQAETELFKWASHDDLYGRDLLQRCVDLLDSRPDAVLAHAWTGAVNEHDAITQAIRYPLTTDSAVPAERFASLLFGGDKLQGMICADDVYGVIRADVLRQMRPLDSFFHSDRTYALELALRGPFVQHPEWLYFRRHHPQRTTVDHDVRRWSANLDPRRSSRLHPRARLLAELAWEMFAVVHRSPLDAADRRACYQQLARWFATRVSRRLSSGRSRAVSSPVNPIDPLAPSLDAILAGRDETPTSP